MTWAKLKQLIDEMTAEQLLKEASMHTDEGRTTIELACDHEGEFFFIWEFANG